MRGLHCTLLATIAATVPIAIANAQSADSAEFTVNIIRIEGLQRVSEGTVYNYLPINIGDRLSATRVREAVRALYATGFFRDVQMRRDGGSLIVVVLERPSIESFEITGNKDIKTEDLQKSLRNVGLATGKTFDRSVLDAVTQSLTDQYYSRGKYAVRIDATVEEKSGNQVKIKIDVKEGKRARIRQINLVGNERFTEKEVLESFELKTPNWLSWYRQDDRYSRESLQGDLEKLRSFYMDRGYANFQVTSTQVAIAPEKDDIFITVNLDEGDVFKLADVKLAGTFVVPEEQLKRFLLTQRGQTFSRKFITATQELLQNRLGEDGYAFAKVEPVPTTNNETHEVTLTYFIDPGNRVYVRNISFSGANKINDEVLRREMRQLEGGWLSNVAVERSKQRIQRLPYVKNVEFTTTPVPGSADLVDVDFNVEEGPSAQLGGGIGYSESQSFILNGSFVDSNFLGGGERIALELNTGAYSKVYSISHTNPYVTMNEVGRTINLQYADVSQLTSDFSEFSTKTYLAGLDYSYPITERQSVRFGASIQHAELATVSTSATQLQDWVEQNGDSFRTELGSVDILGTRFNLLELSTGWGFDSRNRTLFPTRGAIHRFGVSSTIPGSPVEYLTTTYQFQQYFRLPYVPFVKSIPLSFSTRASYARSFGDTSAVPPNRHFFVGGPESVRGFSERTLGPRDSNGNPYGGDTAVSGQFEAIMPLPAKFATSARLSLFYDFGQAFYLGDTQFENRSGFPVDYKFSLKEMRSSVGIGVQWLAPLGLFRFSFAFPLRYRDETELNYGDEIERFQFSIGQAF
jgi:outer membrane protein insertion porin family